MSRPAEEPFLTRPLSVVLNFVRFGAALLVVVGHAVQLGLYHGDFPFGVRMQHYCVIVFFVLSGLVISTSVLGGRSMLWRYAVARISRILPVAIPALIFSTLAAYLLAGPSPVRMDNSPEDALAITKQLLAPLTFISAWPGVAGPVWNPPYWSLCYEVWYYAIFALAAFLGGWRRAVAVGLSCLAAGGAILLLMPAWLFGVALTHVPAARRLPVALAPLVLVAAGWAALALFEIDREVLNPLLKAWWPGDAEWSEWALSDLAMGLIMTVALVGARPLAECLAGPILRLGIAAKNLAGFSFTLYLFHWPLIQLLRSWRIEAGQSFTVFSALIALIVLVCAAISILTERQAPRLRRWMDARFSGAAGRVACA